MIYRTYYNIVYTVYYNYIILYIIIYVCVCVYVSESRDVVRLYLPGKLEALQVKTWNSPKLQKLPKVTETAQRLAPSFVFAYTSKTVLVLSCNAAFPKS